MRTTLVILIFVIAVGGFFSDVLLGGKVLLTTRPSLFDPWRAYATGQEPDARTYRTDSMLTYLPRRAELSESIASGRFPLWNPYILTGVPFFADPQSRVLYPLSLILVPFDAAKALGYDVALHFLLALVGMYLFLRAIAATRAAGALGAFAYGFSSFFATRMGHPTFVASAAWIPFFFYGFELARRGRRTGTLLLAAFFVMGYLAGFPQVLLFGVAGLALYAAALSLDRGLRSGPREGLRSASASAAPLLVAGGLALAVIAVHLVPFQEFVRNSIGLGISFEEMKRLYIFKPVLFLRILVPGLFGNPVEGTNWVPLVQPGVHPYNLGFLVYCGIGTLMVALAGIAFLRQSEHLRALGVVLLASVGLGLSAVVLKMVYAAIPLFRYSQIDRVSVLACFALAATAGKSFSLFAASPDGREKRRFLAIAGALVGLLIVGSVVFAVRGESLLASARHHLTSGEAGLGAGSERIGEWVGGRMGEWLAYERAQILRALGLAVLSFALLLGLAWAGERRRLQVLAGALLVAAVAGDNILAARSYYVSQPAGSVFATEGIKTLTRLAEGGPWRTINEEAASWVLPPNTNQLFGIQSLRGRSTIIPGSYAFLLKGSQPSAGRPVAAEVGNPAAELTDFMSVRFLLASSFNPRMASGIFAAVAGKLSNHSALRTLRLGDDARVAFCQGAADTLSVDVYIPPDARLDFAVGAESGASGPLAAVLTCESPAGRAEFRKQLASYEAGGWSDHGLDVSALGGGYAKVTFAVEGSPGGGPVVGWCGLELVLGDCTTRPVGGGFAVEACGAGIVSLTVASDAADVPLEIAAGPARMVRRVSFPPHSRVRTVELDLGGEPGLALAVTSDSAFTLVRSRRLYQPKRAEPAYDLIYGGDMYIYENAAALERAFCVAASDLGPADRDATAGREGALGRGLGSGPGPRVGQMLAALPGLRCGRTRIVSYGRERIEMDVAVDREVFLLVQDAAYPGWEALVDGEPHPVLATDVGTRAVEVGPGDHRVVMEFKPRTLRWGMVITALGFLAGILYAVRPRRAIAK